MEFLLQYLQLSLVSTRSMLTQTLITGVARSNFLVLSQAKLGMANYGPGATCSTLRFLIQTRKF